MSMSEKGIEMLERMLGSKRTAEVRAGWSKLSPDFDNFVTNFLVQDVWSRTNLDLKTRSLITIAASTALGRVSALRLHIEMGLNNGATEAEIEEALLHLAFYAGFPAAWDALVIADEVFSRIKSAGQKAKTAA
jgi:alkylhydroperoxidase/carboxymuconolactone decarboxylase family protein YurZ